MISNQIRTICTCGLKARATLAWGNAPGSRTLTDGGLKARVKCLIPREPLIKGNTVLGKHRPHLGLKVAPGMMLGLVVDIPDQGGPVAQANGERRIPALRPESLAFSTFVVIRFAEEISSRSTDRDTDSVRAKYNKTCM